MAQDSIAYGESLLADIRKRNKETADRARKDARNDAWKQFGMKVAIGLAEDIMQTKQQNFLNQEAAYARQSGLNKAVETAGTMLNDIKASEDYAGGKKAYLMDNPETGLVGKVESQLQSLYVPGTYNEALLSATARKIADSYYDRYEADWDKNAEATKQFFKNYDTETYNNTINELAGGSTFGDFITGNLKKLPIISQLSGDLDKDALQTTLSSYKDAVVGEENSLKAHQEAFKLTSSGALSEFVLKEVTEDNAALKDMGQASLKYSHEMKNVDVFDPFTGEQTGEKVVIIQTGVSPITGQVMSVKQINPDGTSVTPSTVAPRDYYNDVAKIIGADQAGGSLAWLTSNANAANIENINKKRDDYVSEAGYAGLRGDALNTLNANKDEILAGELEVNARRLQAEIGSSLDFGRTLALELQIMNTELPFDKSIRTNVGKGNFLNTMKAYHRIYAGNKGQSTTTQIASMNNYIESNQQEIFREFMRLNPNEKADFITSMGDGKLSDGKYNHFKGVFNAFESLMDNMMYSFEQDSGTLIARPKANNNNDNSSASTDNNTDSQTTVVVDDKGFDALVVPPAAPSRTASRTDEGKAIQKQRRAYKLLERYNASIASLEAKTGGSNNYPGKTRDIRSLENLKSAYTAAYNDYMKQYAPETDNTSLLAST